MAKKAKPKPKKGKGKQENKAKKQIRTDYFKVYAREATPLSLDDQKFRFSAIRAGLGMINIDGYVESCEWRDEGSEVAVNTIPVLRGSIALRRPYKNSPGYNLTLKDGHMIRCEVFWGGRWTECWRMRIQKPSLAYAEGSWTFELADDLILASKSTASFKYVKGKKRRKKGWYYHEIVKDICREFRIPLGQVTRGKKRITSFQKAKVSPLEAIRLVTQDEVEHSGKRLIIAWRWDNQLKRSALNIIPMRRNKVLYHMEGHLRGADITAPRRADTATALVLRGVKKGNAGKGDKGDKRKKIKTTVTNAKAIRQYGYIQHDFTVDGTVESLTELRQRGKRELAKRLQVKPVLENVSHAGIAFVRRGDAVRIRIPEEGYKGKNSIMFVTSVVHSLSAGDYTMSLTLGSKDPMDPNDIRKEREKTARLRKRKKKGKPKKKVAA